MVGTGASSRPCWGRMRGSPSLPCNTRPGAISAGPVGLMQTSSPASCGQCLVLQKGRPVAPLRSALRATLGIGPVWRNSGLGYPTRCRDWERCSGRQGCQLEHHQWEPRRACLMPSLSAPPVRDSEDGGKERADLPGSWNSLALSYLTPAMSTCSRTDPRGKCILQLSKHSGGKRLQSPLF